MRARVKNGRWVFDDPTDLPEGTEVEIVTRTAKPASPALGDVYLDAKLREYIRALLFAACSPKYSSSPRGLGPNDEENLIESAKAYARQGNRAYTTPEDVKKAAPEVLHRFVTADGIRAILDDTPLP
jgi:hypothetical protein